MQVEYHKRFVKAFNKLPVKIQEKFYERLRLFDRDHSHLLLNNHSVGSAYPGWRSINITGDYRALYQPIGGNLVIFMKIGSHSELYG